MVAGRRRASIWTPPHRAGATLQLSARTARSAQLLGVLRREDQRRPCVVRIHALRCPLLGALAAARLWRREISALRWLALITLPMPSGDLWLSHRTCRTSLFYMWERIYSASSCWGLAETRARGVDPLPSSMCKQAHRQGQPALSSSRCGGRDSAATFRHCTGTGDDLRVLASLVAACRDELTRSPTTRDVTRVDAAGFGAGGTRAPRRTQLPQTLHPVSALPVRETSTSVARPLVGGTRTE